MGHSPYNKVDSSNSVNPSELPINLCIGYATQNFTTSLKSSGLDKKILPSRVSSFISRLYSERSLVYTLEPLFHPISFLIRTVLKRRRPDLRDLETYLLSCQYLHKSSEISKTITRCPPMSLRGGSEKFSVLFVRWVPITLESIIRTA